MASLNRALTGRQLLLTVLALWILVGIVSLALTYLGRSHGVVRSPVLHSVRH